jgi:cytochrome c-type biogenesis protein CcmH/NrfF
VIRPAQRRPSYLALAWLLAALSVTAAAWSEPATEDQARRAHAIANQVMSPFCPGSTVATCTSPRAAEWRADILTWVKEGHSEAEIRTRLQQRVPGKDLSGTATSAWSWGLPAVVVVAGGSLLIWLLRRFVRTRPRPEPESASGDSELDERLDRELERLDD